MFGPNSRIPPAISAVASALGLSFATSSTLDYAAHLDRRLHDLHCSFVPGAPPTDAAEACRTAMYSPYAALFRDKYWGGIPISLFAVGAFTFFAGFLAFLAAFLAFFAICLLLWLKKERRCGSICLRASDRRPG